MKVPMERARDPVELHRAPMRQRVLPLLLLVLFLKSCIVYPKFAASPEEFDCRLISRSLCLDAFFLPGSCDIDLTSCLLGLILVGGSSTVVSGSIVLVGNTIHWLERKGRCSEERALVIESARESSLTLPLPALASAGGAR